MVDTDGLTVMELPAPSGVPPHEPEYHCQFAAVPNEPPLTRIIELPPGQTNAGDAAASVGSVEALLI